MHLRSRRARLLAAASALLVPVGVLATVQPAAAAPSGLVPIASTLPRWLPKTHGKVSLAVPDAPAGQQLSIKVFLAPQGGTDALAKAALAVSTPGSATYGQFVTADQFHARYAPSAAAEKTVRSFLTSKGLTVTGTAPFRRYVTATGTVAQLDDAFAVSLKKLTNAKQNVIAPTTAASLPSKVASQVLTVDGLDTTAVKMQHGPKATEPPAGFRNAKPCSTYWGQVKATYQADYKTKLPKFDGKTLNYAPCGYTGPQLRGAYEGDTNLTGAGATVAITDAYRWQLIAGDANRYASEHGDGSYVKGQLTENLPAAGYNREDACDPSGWSGEETLDVEAVHAMAPAANIRYYASSSCFDDDFLDTLGRVADDGVAQVVTNSWGDVAEIETSDQIVAYQSVFQQLALQGISTAFSSGDNGDELDNTGIKQVDYPTSDPYVTSVGGTSTAINPSLVRLDTGWGTSSYALSADGKSWEGDGSFLYGAGGGVSTLFNQPAYQRGVVNPRLSGGRAVPDLAMDADPQTGMLVGQTQTFSNGVYYGEYRIGGTSLASPLFAGMVALAVQHNGGRGFGLLNPVIYKNTKMFDDVKPQANLTGVVRANYVNGENNDDGVSYFVRTFAQDSSLKTTNGWDQVTGRGVPRPSFLYMKTPANATAAAKR